MFYKGSQYSDQSQPKGVDPHRHAPYTEILKSFIVCRGLWQALKPLLDFLGVVLIFSLADSTHHVLYAKYHV